MNSARTYLPFSAPGPILRLLIAPRALLVFIGGAAWTLGTGWMGAMARFAHVDPTPAEESSVFGAIVVALLLFGIPALVGVVVGEAAQELFRRPATNRLPAARKRVSGAALTLGLCVTTLTFGVVQLGWEPWGLALPGAAAAVPCPLATFAIALAGFASGSWLLVRIGYGWGWFLRFAGFMGLSYAALPLLAAGTESTIIAFVMVALAFVAASQRFHRSIVERMAAGSVPTIFGNVGGWRGSEEQRAQALSRNTSDMPSGVLGRDLQGWIRAREYEQRTARNGTQAWQSLLLFAAIPVVLSHIGPIVSWILGSTEGESFLSNLAKVLLGNGELAPGVMHSIPPGLGVIFGMAAGAQAFLASFPLCSHYFHPISRTLRTRLAFRTALVVGLTHSAATLVLGLVLGACLAFAGGSAWPSGIPAIAVVVLVNLVLFPWFVLASIHLRWAIKARRMLRAALIFLVPAVLVFGFMTELVNRFANDLWRSSPPLAIAAAAGSVALGFAVLRSLLARHYAKSDLA